jgi:hypothetical protein
MSTVLHPGHEQPAASLARAMSGHVELTVADLPENTEVGVRLELIDASLYVNALADFDHQDLVSDLVARLRPVTPEGMRVLAGVNVIDGPSTLVEPDVAVVDPACVTADRRGVSPAGVLLAVEVTSRSTRRRDLTIKRDLLPGVVGAVPPGRPVHPPLHAARDGERPGVGEARRRRHRRPSPAPRRLTADPPRRVCRRSPTASRRRSHPCRRPGPC